MTQSLLPTWTRRRFLTAAGAGALFWSLRPLLGRAQSDLRWESIPAVNPGPAPRLNHALVYDPQGDRLIVFGGSAPGFVNDVWAFALETRTWTELTPDSGPTPAPRRTPRAVYDMQAHRFVTYSGQGRGFFNDTWAFDLNQNAWAELAGEPRPAPRYGTVFPYDPNRHAGITFAGFTHNGRFDDTWRFSLEREAWEPLGPDGPRPQERCLHMGVYDPERDRLLIFGGQRAGALGDLWAFDAGTNAWRELTGEPRPAPRMFATLDHDAEGDRLLLFGGRGAETFGDLWAFDLDAERWSQLSPAGDAPAPRSSHAAAFVPGRGLYVFGGSGPDGALADVWLLQAA